MTSIDKTNPEPKSNKFGFKENNDSGLSANNDGNFEKYAILAIIRLAAR